MDYVIRPLEAADEAILWEMLYVALQAPGGEPPPRDIVQRPEYARFVEGWGREGDRGFVAHDSRDRRLLGAVWMREPTKNAAPELAVAVVPGERKRGIGAALLTQWVRANPEQNEVLLHVGRKSPAVRLYERFGFRVAETKARAVTMRREG